MQLAFESYLRIPATDPPRSEHEPVIFTRSSEYQRCGLSPQLWRGECECALVHDNEGREENRIWGREGATS